MHNQIICATGYWADIQPVGRPLLAESGWSGLAAGHPLIVPGRPADR